MSNKILQEAAEVMRTDFWKIYADKLNKLRGYVAQRFYGDDIKSQEQWVQHAVYQGEMRAIDKVLGLPDEILKEQRGTPVG